MSKQKHIAIKASKKSISSIVLSILMLLSVIPLHSSTIYADGTGKTVMNGTGNIQKTDRIWFGILGAALTNPKTEIQWRVLDTKTNTDEDGIFLLSENLIGRGQFGEVQFNKTSSEGNKWQGSDAQKWCKNFSGEGGNEYFKSLTEQELDAIKATTKSDKEIASKYYKFAASDNILSGDKIFLLSVEEATNKEYGFSDNWDYDTKKRAYFDGKEADWWLRSPHGSYSIYAGIVGASGNISVKDVDLKVAARPAFNLDKTKVLFTSPAIGGKQSNGVGKNALKSVGDANTAEWKLTLKDNSRKFQLDAGEVTGKDLELTIPYKNAMTGTKEHISAIVEKNGIITHYGNVLQLPAGKESGTVTVQLPADFDKKTDKLYLINEQLNGDKKTDYSSAKIEIAIPEAQPLVFEDKDEYDIPAGEQGEMYTATTALSAKGGTEPYKFTVEPAVEGLSINGENKLVYTRPKAQEAITATIKVTDNANPTAEKTITINIGKVTAPQLQPQEYTVTVKSNNTTMGKVAPDKVEHVTKDTPIVENGNKLTINGKEVIATAESGYKFKNWMGIPADGKVTDNITVTAIFEKEQSQPPVDKFTVIVKSTDTDMGTVSKEKVENVATGTAISASENELTVGTEKIIATAKSGHKFEGWQGVPQNGKVTEDLEIRAIFQEVTPLPPQPQPTKHNIKLTDDGNGTTKSMVGGAEVTKAEQGKKVTITATPYRGYKFDEWRVLSGGVILRDEDSTTTTFTMPNKDVEIKAYFKKKSSGGSSHDTEYYYITTKADKHGTVEARSKAREGTEVSVTVDPDKGYKLDEITVTDKRGRDIKIKETNRENRYKFTMPARDVTIEATFKQIKQEQPSQTTPSTTVPGTTTPSVTMHSKQKQTTIFTIGSNIMTVITDGKPKQTVIDAKPFLSRGRTMIPVRYAAESLGMQVEWNKQTRTVVLKDKDNTVMIPIKTNKIMVGNQTYTSDVKPIVKEGRTYLTISNIAKALRMRAGQDVKWDNKIKQVTIIKEVEVR